MSYIGAVLNSGILLLTIHHWTTEVAAFPLFILTIASVQVLVVGLTLGPRLRRARATLRGAVTPMTIGEDPTSRDVPAPGSNSF
jgi:hypothetical protein